MIGIANRMEKLRQGGMDDDKAAETVEKDGKRGIVTDDGGLIEPRKAWAKLKEGLPKDVRDAVVRSRPDYEGVLDSEPEGWRDADEKNALGCIRLIIEIHPAMLGQLSESTDIVDDMAADLDTDEAPKPVTAESIHETCAKIGIDYESEDFMAACEATTGNRHLDDMDEADLRKVADALSKIGKATSSPE